MKKQDRRDDIDNDPELFGGVDNEYFDDRASIPWIEGAPTYGDTSEPLPATKLPAADFFRGFLSPQEAASLRESMRGREGDIMGMTDGKRSLVTSYLLIEMTPGEFGWLYERMGAAMVEANKRCWRFDLRGFVEPLEFLEYGERDAAQWHTDYGDNDRSKLTAILMLSQVGRDYDGGELQVIGQRRFTLSQGDLVVFPAYIAHRVTAVTSGERCIVGGWLAGPPLI